MKITLAIAAIAAVGTSSLAAAADIRVTGARDTVAMRGAVGGNKADNMADVKVKIATADILNKPTALINKNTLAMDNNVFVSRSNIVFSQSDRLALADALTKKVEKIVTSASSHEAHATGMDTNMNTGTDMDATTAVLTKSVLRAVSGSDTDAALMTKASAVVAAKNDASTRGQRIADLVRAALDAKQMQTEQTEQTEQTIQSETPRGVIVMIGTKDILRQPTAAVNKNIAVTDTQVAVSRSHVMPSQNDNIVLAGGAKVADAVLPASAIDVSVDKSKIKDKTTDSAVSMESAADNYRVGFLYNKAETTSATATAGDATDGVDGAAEKEKEQFWGGGLGFGGLGFGWRYPLGYWNLYGAGLYGGGCGFGRAFGPYFYC